MAKESIDLELVKRCFSHYDRRASGKHEYSVWFMNLRTKSKTHLTVKETIMRTLWSITDKTAMIRLIG